MSTQRISEWLAKVQVGRAARWLAPNGGTLLIVALLLMTQSLWARPLAAPNAPGPSATEINYQANASDSAGNPITGEYAITFTIYDALTGGNVIWGPEIHPVVNIQDGLFSVGLGSILPGGIPTTVWDGDRYLEVTIGSQTLAPRELIRAVPIAHVALQALTLSVDTVNGAMLAHSGFGSSSVALNNFVVRGPVTSADLTTTAEVLDGVIWDLSPIVGNSAEMVLLYVYIDDDAADSYFQIVPTDVAANSRYNAPFVKPTNVNNSSGHFIWVRCDSSQQIKYKIDAKSSDGILSELGVTVVGWFEPAATP